MAKQKEKPTIYDSHLLALFNFARDYSFGTLWWVAEPYWEEHIPGYSSDRKKHPGFSICRQKATGLRSNIPLLYGTSCYCARGFYVTDLSESYPKTHRTWFGSMEKPVQTIPLAYFGEEPPVIYNSHKYRATKKEIATAEQFLRRVMKKNGGEK
ncbi:MAG: hypothetical protein MJ016_03215 [Victivallaceae bacterium]|nr:hypothetical protein [Victivallaceae bacterium]